MRAEDAVFGLRAPAARVEPRQGRRGRIRRGRSWSRRVRPRSGGSTRGRGGLGVLVGGILGTGGLNGLVSNHRHSHQRARNVMIPRTGS